MLDREKKEWLSLKDAANILSVHTTTLRRWADKGQIPVMVTPGGHRRFSRKDLDHFLKDRHQLATPSSVEQVWAEKALTVARQEVAANSASQTWLTSIDEDKRLVHRQLGRQLMGVTLQYISSEPENQLFLEDARLIGIKYGQIGTEMGLPLTEALKAAIFFKDHMVETALQLPGTAQTTPEANVRLMKRINNLLNEVQLAIAEVYEHQSTDHSLPGN